MSRSSSPAMRGNVWAYPNLTSLMLQIYGKSTFTFKSIWLHTRSSHHVWTVGEWDSRPWDTRVRNDGKAAVYVHLNLQNASLIGLRVWMRGHVSYSCCFLTERPQWKLIIEHNCLDASPFASFTSRSTARANRFLSPTTSCTFTCCQITRHN